MIDKQTLFEIWAPAGEVWSGWVKPVLFAHWPRELPRLEVLPSQDPSWAPSPSERLALLVEMPGDQAVLMGLALAEVGYRPVPLFNASLPPFKPRHPREPPPFTPAVVDVEAILAEIVQGAEVLKNIKIPPTAPPAFLIDLLRSSPFRPVEAGVFDNRSWLYNTDLPTADLLRSEGIDGLVLFTTSSKPLATDLEHVLRVRARDGLPIYQQVRGKLGPPRPLTLAGPSWFTALKLRLKGLFVDPVLGHGNFVQGSSG